MKGYSKFRMRILALWMIFVVLSPMSSKASGVYDYDTNSCGLERGLDVVFVINDSPIMRAHDREGSGIAESMNFIKTLQPNDRVAVVGFNGEAKNYQPLTVNRFAIDSSLKRFISTEPTPIGGNDLSTGLELALDEIERNTNENDKMIIVMTTGTSANNSLSLELAQQAYEENIKIHIFGFGPSTDIDRTNLERISRKTGGDYYHAPNAISLANDLSKLNKTASGFEGREVFSDWKLTQDVQESRGLMLHENVKVDLNGYDLTVDGDLVLLSCSELRAVSGVVSAKNIDQKSRSNIRLNNSQLHVKDMFIQDGLVVVNGDFGGASQPEIDVLKHTQMIHGFLDLKGQRAVISGDFLQEGRIDFGAGSVHVKGNLHQKGYFNVQQGKLQVDGNLTIDGGLLKDEAFTENKSLNVGEGVVQVGSAASMKETRTKGNAKQLGGQLFVNHGTVKIYGDYSIADGWLTMVKGSMDTATSEYGEGDGDFVHVHGNFAMESPRNHAKRYYTQLSNPMHDQGHLTDGVLKVDGSFIQKGNQEGHSIYTDRAQNYEKSYTRTNFQAAGRHKVVLTGKQAIQVEGSGFTFNLLELHGKLHDYSQIGPVKWNRLIEIDKAANANLASLSINDVPVLGFNPIVKNYFNHVVSSDSFTGGVRTLKIDARAEDHRNAQVQVLNSVVNTDGTSVVKILVTAADGVTQSVYTVYVKVGSGSGGKVTGIELDREELLFTQEAGGLKPEKVTIGYTVYPTNAVNQQVNWTTTNPAVAIVNPSGIVTPISIGEATIVATTDDGNFIDSVTVKVLKQIDLLEGIKTLADLVSDNDRYDKIMSGIYDLDKIGIVVPGGYIEKVSFNSSGNLVIGTVKAKTATVNRVEVRINGQQLGTNTGSNANEFLFTRSGLSFSDYIEVIAYDATSNELERVATTYPVAFESGSVVSPGFYSIQRLFSDPVTFNVLLSQFSPEQLRFSIK